MILQAEGGWNMLILRTPGGVRVYEEERIMRLPVIAWEFLENGCIAPRVCYPFMDRSREFALETPEGVVIAFNVDMNRSGIMCANVGEWLDLVRQALTHAPAAAPETLQ